MIRLHLASDSTYPSLMPFGILFVTASDTDQVNMTLRCMAVMIGAWEKGMHNYVCDSIFHIFLKVCRVICACIVVTRVYGYRLVDVLN